MSLSMGTAVAGGGQVRERETAPENHSSRSSDESPATTDAGSGQDSFQVSAEPLYSTDKYRRVVPLLQPDQLEG